MVVPLQIWCNFDRCCEFTPETINRKYCAEHGCAKKAENSRRRLQSPLISSEESWRLQENRKLDRLLVSQNKNRWIEENSNICFFDIETTNLSASIGMMICACVKDKDGETYTFKMSKENGLFNDHKAVVEIRDFLESYDYVVTYYGTRFDIPYLNTRLIMYGERPLQRLRHIDLYFTAKFKLKLHSNKLAVVCETLFGDTEKTRVIGNTWNQALMGDKQSMDYIVEHCQIDVAELEKVYDELKGFINLSAVRWRVFGGSY